MSDTSDPLEILNAIDRERGDSSIGMIQANQVQRLRTEIVALRRTIMLGPDLPARARIEALEEAAMVADRWQERTEFDKAAAIAAAIRALKKQRL